MFLFIISVGSPFFRSLIQMANTIFSFGSPPCLILSCASATVKALLLLLDSFLNIFLLSIKCYGIKFECIKMY